MTKVDLLLPADYVADAAARVRVATERVVLLSMIIADQPATHELIDALIEAAQRGVKVQVAADILTISEVSGTFVPFYYFSKASREARGISRLLKEAGVEFEWLGEAHMTFFNGRTHSKWCIVDDTVYSFGGVNIYQAGIKNNDFILRATSHDLADQLTNEYDTLRKSDRSGRLYKSHQFDFGNDHILVDGGMLGNSIIYHHACELADSAQRIVFVSQYPPTGKLSRILRSKDSAIYFNPPERAPFPNNIVILYSQFRNQVASHYKRMRYLHAKFIIFYMPDGSRVALTGSHNFNYTVVILGTREIALETRQASIIDQLETFLKEKVI